MKPLHDLPELLTALNPQAELVQRHLWLIALFDWLRGDCRSVAASIARIELLLDAVQARPELTERLQAWWQTLVDTIDGTALLADYGFASRSAFISEFFERIRLKLLPGTPETADASALFSLVLCHGFDAQWLAAIDEIALARIQVLLQPPTSMQADDSRPALSQWQSTVLEALTFCTSQVSAAGFTPELRLRMSAPAREAGPFHCLVRDFETLRDVYRASPANDSDERQAALQQFRERVLRIRALLDCLLSNHPATSTARLLSHLVSVGQERRSLRALIASSIIAGWAENWFVLHRLDSALRYNPKITAALGERRAGRWAHFMRDNVSGLTANVSLGLMFGLIPAFATFFGLELEVRHVTLSTGQLAAVAATLGLNALTLSAFWWCLAGILVTGVLNVGVSFYFAFRLALLAHNVSGVDRVRIHSAISARWRSAPLSFFWPAKEVPHNDTPDKETTGG